MLQEKEKNIYYLFLDLPSVLTAAKLVIPHTTLSILILTLRKQKKVLPSLHPNAKMESFSISPF